MKKSIRRKLIMSAVAVGAAALATTSSTYAWFVSNADVKTNVISGNVSSSEANLQISADGSSYGLSVTPSLSGTKLTPITKEAGAAFGTYKRLSGAAQESDYISFKLYFKASGLSAGNWKLQLKPSTDAAAPKDLNKDDTYTPLADVAAANNYTEIKAGTGISEDVTKALYLSVGTNNIPFNGAKGTYDGVAYYNKVTGESATSSVVTAYGKALKDNDFSCDIWTGTASDDGQTKTFEIDFQIWLDGADDAGFDAIASHAWTVGLNFTLTKGE